MADQVSDATREKFYGDLTSLLRTLKPGQDLPDPKPETHLWAEGYVDSLGMLEIIYFLEDQLGCEIDLVGDFLPNFYTLKSMYETYVDPSSLPGNG